MPSILLVDDDSYYRGALSNSLRLAGHQVTEAEDAAEAQKILRGKSFDLVISDIRMPGMNGVDLLQWIKAQHPHPVILITGFSELLETKQAAELGADDFLLKPFNSADIEASIRRVLGAKAAQTPAPEVDLDASYCKIPLEDFITGSRICFDIYLRISKSRYLKIAYGGEDISVDRVRGYKKKGLKSLFLARDDFAKYVGFNLSLLRKVGKAKGISAEKRLNFLRYSGEVILERLFLEGVDSEEFSSAKEFVSSTLEILQDHDEAFTMLEALNKHADFVYAHSLGTSIYGVMTAKAMNWTATPTLFRISLSALMHDLGLKEVSREILDKPRTALTANERSQYETHPARAMELLNTMAGVPSDVILVAYQHHENWVGFGYPQKLSKSKTHPLARLIHVVDLFCDYAIESPGNPKLSAKEALAQMATYFESSLDPAAFTGLKSLFGLRPA